LTGWDIAYNVFGLSVTVSCDVFGQVFALFVMSLVAWTGFEAACDDI
jgi:hypothetical protein